MNMSYVFGQVVHVAKCSTLSLQTYVWTFCITIFPNSRLLANGDCGTMCRQLYSDETPSYSRLIRLQVVWSSVICFLFKNLHYKNKMIKVCTRACTFFRNRQWVQQPPVSNCSKHFHWLIELFWPIRFNVTIVSNVKRKWSESPVKKVNLENLLYKWVLSPYIHYVSIYTYK